MFDTTSDLVPFPEFFSEYHVHLGTACWLTANGFTYQHEVPMPEWGRADFVAFHEHGSVIIVECKRSLENVGMACIQVADYCLQYGSGAKPVLAIPLNHNIAQRALQITARRHIAIIEVEPKIEKHKLIERFRSRFLSGAINFFQVPRGDDFEKSLPFTITSYIRNVFPLMLQGNNVQFHQLKEDICQEIALQTEREPKFIMDLFNLMLSDSSGNSGTSNLFVSETEVQSRLEQRLRHVTHEASKFRTNIDVREFTGDWITKIWRKRGAKAGDINILWDQIAEIVHAKTAMVSKYDTMRNYDAAADQYLTALTEMTAGALHEWRDSTGLPELSEDVDDTKPIVDAARPHAYQAFSKKTRRLHTGDKPKQLE